jgi:hypothetical protein
MPEFLRRLFGHPPPKGNVDRFYAVVEKHGYGEVPAKEVYGLFDSTAASGLGGFAMIKPGFYVRVVSEDVAHVVKLQALKGLAHGVFWGVSLSCVPHLQAGRARWHRTPKAARFDLFETPFDYFDLAGKEPEVCERYVAYNGHRIDYLRETMTRMWTIVDDPIRSWFAGTQDLAGVLAKAEEQRHRAWHGARHDPDPLVVCAFTLARLGRTAEARARLDEYLATSGTPEPDAGLLRGALGV